MFLKARQWFRLILLALAVQVGNLAKVGKRKVYGDKYENQRQLRQDKNDFKHGIKSNWRGTPRLPLGDLSKSQLSLTGKFEPASDLPTVTLSETPHSAKGGSSCLSCMDSSVFR